MKKAKMMLTAVTVLAVVGGALAFKAKKFGERVFITGENNQCTLEYIDHTITVASDPLAVPYDATSVATTDPCPATFIKEKF